MIVFDIEWNHGCDEIRLDEILQIGAVRLDKIGKTQKLKQYFINEKIPQNIRDKIWLVADGQEIMWIVGYRQNQAYQITDKTTKIMEICFESKDIDWSQRE